MIFEIIFRIYPEKYGMKKSDFFDEKEREKIYINSLAKLVDEIIDFSYYYSKDKEYEEIFVEARLKDARSITMNKIRKVLYRQFYNDEILGFNPSGEILEAYLERVVFES